MIRFIVLACVLVGCGSEPQSDVVAPASEAAPADAPDLSLLLVAGLRSAPSTQHKSHWAYIPFFLCVFDDVLLRVFKNNFWETHDCFSLRAALWRLPGASSRSAKRVSAFH